MGPVGFYTSLGRGHTRSCSGSGGVSTASYQRELATAQRDAAQQRQVEAAKGLLAEFERILNLHRVEFPRASPPVAPPAAPPDRTAIYAHFERHALQGISVLRRAERAEAKRCAASAADAEVLRLWHAQVDQNRAAQAYLDQRWRALCANDPDTVLATLADAFEDNHAPSAAVGIDGDEVSLSLLVPRIEDVIPDQWPTVSAVGYVSSHPLDKRERADYYTVFVCGQALVAVREALAVAVGVRAARVVVLRVDGYNAFGEPKVVCLLAARFDRAVLERVVWASAGSSDIVNDASSEIILNQSSTGGELTAIDLATEPALRELIETVDMTELGAPALAAPRGVTAAAGSSPRVTAGATKPNLVAVTAAKVAEYRRELDRLSSSTAGGDLRSEMQAVVQGAVDAVTEVFGEVGDLIVAEIKAGGQRERHGRAAVPQLEEGMAAMQVVTQNAKGRDPHALMDDVEAVLPPLDLALSRIPTG